MRYFSVITSQEKILSMKIATHIQGDLFTPEPLQFEIFTLKSVN